VVRDSVTLFSRLIEWEKLVENVTNPIVWLSDELRDCEKLWLAVTESVSDAFSVKELESDFAADGSSDMVIYVCVVLTVTDPVSLTDFVRVPTPTASMRGALEVASSRNVKKPAIT
jgi:hypothetical protein